MAQHSDVIIALMQKEKYIHSAAECLRGIVANNGDLCQSLSARLIFIIPKLTELYGRRIILLRLLQKITNTAQRPIANAQQIVCKGAMLSSILVVSEILFVSVLDTKVLLELACCVCAYNDLLQDISGHLNRDDWGQGIEISRIDAIKIAANDDQTNEMKIRCQKGIQYYCESMLMLALCTAGDNSATELLCASLLPFHDVMLRLWVSSFLLYPFSGSG